MQLPGTHPLVRLKPRNFSIERSNRKQKTPPKVQIRKGGVKELISGPYFLAPVLGLPRPPLFFSTVRRSTEAAKLQ